MAFDWLFGPKGTRSYRLDLDTVRELGEAVKEAYPDMVIDYWVTSAPGVVRHVNADQLAGLSEADLSRLTLDARVVMPEGQVYFGPLVNISLARAWSGSQVMAAPAADGAQHTDDALLARINQILSDSSRPLVRWRRLPRARALVFWLPFVALLAGWLWLELTSPLPIPVHVIGWAIVVIAFLVIRPLYQSRRYSASAPPPMNGHIVLSETRHDTAVRRADHRRDIRIALYSIGGTILAGLVVAIILYFTLGIGAPAPVPTPTP